MTPAHTGGRRELERRVRRVDSLVRELQELPDEHARAIAAEAFRALLELHGDALGRLVDLAGPEITARLADDPSVAGMLLLHDLHPVPFDQRVQRALDGIRPYLGSHGGGVRLLEARDGAVRLRLEGTCEGCPSSAATIRLAIEQAILDAVPDVAGIEVEGAAEVPAAAPSGFVPLAAIAGPGPRSEWCEVPALDGLAPGALLVREVAGERIALCMAGGERYAYRDRCPSCGASLEAAGFDGAGLSCAGCGGRYDVRRAGRSLDGASLHLEPVPLVAADGVVRVAVAAGAAGAP